MFAPLRSMVLLFLTDTCTIGIPAAAEFDKDTGTYPDDPPTEVYAGACRVRPSGGERVVQAGEGPTSLRTFDVTVPWDTVGVKLDHLVTITGSDDPHLIGRIFRVIDVQGMSDAAYRRLVCEDTLSVTYVEVEA